MRFQYRSGLCNFLKATVCFSRSKCRFFNILTIIVFIHVLVCLNLTHFSSFSSCFPTAPPSNRLLGVPSRSTVECPGLILLASLCCPSLNLLDLSDVGVVGWYQGYGGKFQHRSDKGLVCSLLFSLWWRSNVPFKETPG